MEHVKVDKPVFKSESSVMSHPWQFPAKTEQLSLPTWGILAILIVTFFVLKFFIYIKDDQRHGK
jgi:hypothetical protein